MVPSLSDVYLVRYGEAQSSLSGQHTGLTNLPLTKQGEEQARRVRRQLIATTFAKVFSSTCAISGYGSVARADRVLIEWGYGDYEGKRRSEILVDRPGWVIFRDGCPNGESPEHVGIRADRVLSRIREVGGNVLVFSGGHFLRVLMARWLGLEPAAGRYFKLGTAALCVLGYDHSNRAEPVMRLLNQTTNEKAVC